MSDTIGRITVPAPTVSGLTFPLRSEYGYGMTRDWEVVEHRFGALAELGVQRFYVGAGARRFQFVKSSLSISDRASLLSFYSAVQGSFQSFIYAVPNTDRTTFNNYNVIFDSAPLSISDLAAHCQTGISFIEIVSPSSAPTYPISSTSTRFPSPTLATYLSSEVQQIIPLVHIRVRNSAVPDIYLSDRRCTVGSQLYLPRVLSLGEAGSDIVMSQDIKGTADNTQLTFGNADRVMSALCRDTSLKYADIDITLARVRDDGTVDLLQLWKGVILSWTVDGTSQFSIQCSDGLYPVTQQYPRRTVSRKCWKTFDDGINCPYSTAGSGGDPTSCDYFFNTPNGCLSHGMSPYYGGLFTIPQSVFIKDEGTGHLTIALSPLSIALPVVGLFHWSKDSVTSTSIVADNIWGNPLPEIWCNDLGDPRQAMIVNATVVAVRDESTFEDVLGIVGAGPLGAYEGMSVQTNADGYKFIVAPLADGFPPQGFQVDSQLQITGYHPELGLREVLGTDPVTPTTDAFSLGQGTPQRWDIPDPTYSNILTGQTHDILPFSAGTAFVELRYAKDPGKGIAPTTTGAHSMSIPIARGLTGVTYDSGGAQSVVSGLTNPFWVAVNTYFRALGIDRADSLIQIATIDIPSIIAAAAVADQVVTPIIGSGTETQFRFQGTLSQFKPFRDWLTEILTCALGYYTFDFGKLRLGIRSNASAVSAFTLGNILYQSLSISPADAAFEYLRLDFGNAALQYQEDMAEYEDKDYSAYMGRSGAPLSSHQRSIGLASLSQGLRLVTCRTREEIGGILRPDVTSNPYIEWDNNGVVTFKSTILSLETAVGQVVSITHPDIPTYPGPVGGSPSPDNTWKYRIIKWTLHKDWSITIYARSVTDSMYDLEVGPTPLDVSPPALPILFFSAPLGQWAPWQVQASSSDALFPSEYTFDLSQSQTIGENGKPLIEAVMTGKIPVNQFIPGCGAPDVKKGNVTQSATGGSLLGGKTYRVQVCATNATGRYSPPSDILIIQTPTGTNTNQFSIVNVQWPAIAGLTGYVVFASDVDDLVCGQATGVMSGTVGTYSPTTIAVTAAFSRSTYGVPNPAISLLRCKGRRLIHGGVTGAVVSVGGVGSSTITATDTVDSAHTDNWAGRVLAIIGRPLTSTPPTIPFEAFNITAFNNSTGVFTLDRNPTTAGIQDGDVLVVCFLGYDNSATPYVIADSGLSNASNSHMGETVDDPNRIGNYIQVIKGTGRGSFAKIVSNTSTSYTLDTPLVIDATSVWIVVTAAWEVGGSPDLEVVNSDSSSSTSITITINNYAGLPMVFEGVTVDVGGNESSISSAPCRMMWVFGAQGTRTVTAASTQLPTDGLVRVDTSGATPPTPDTLNGSINSSITTITLTTGTSTVNGTYIQIGTEKMYVTNGGGTANLTVDRGALGTTPSSHLTAASVILPGAIPFTLLPISSIPNQEIIVEKVSTDLNYVLILTGSTDVFKDGSNATILPDAVDRSIFYGKAKG